MAGDIRSFIQGCQECGISQQVNSFLCPYLNAHGHLGVDFITIIFFKACQFILLKKLPTVIETAEIMFNHVFHNFGLPEDIVSDRGPQFISHVWKSFTLLGVTVSLSSGYQTNGHWNGQRKIQEICSFLKSFLL